jgi:hypothetical protein
MIYWCSGNQLWFTETTHYHGVQNITFKHNVSALFRTLYCKISTVKQLSEIIYLMMDLYGQNIFSRGISSTCGLETEITAWGICRTDHVIPLYPQKLAPSSPTSGGRSVGIVRSWTKATESVSQSFPALVWSCGNLAH